MRNKSTHKTKFTKWVKWGNRNELANIGLPGVYVFAMSRRDISGTEFSWSRDVIYIGMSNAKAGIKARLKQFDNSIKGKRGHSGGIKIRRDHKNYKRLVSEFFVSIAPFTDKVNARPREDEKIIKRTLITKIEHDFLAQYFSNFRRLPTYNGKR